MYPPSDLSSEAPVTDANIYSLFESRFPARGEPVLETGEGRVYSYADLEAHSARFASALADLGVGPGERVAVQVDKSPEALFLYLGCLRAGCIYLPLNTAYKPEELDYFLENAEPAVLVCRPKAMETAQELAAERGVAHVFSLGADGTGTLAERARGAADGFATVSRQADDIAVILYTSGTTGRPKGAMITHGNLAANGLALQEAWDWRREDVLLHALPIFHIHGLFVACHNVLLGGSKMIFLPRFDAEALLRHLPRATVLMGVPTFYTRLLAQPGLDRETCRHVRLFISGSAPLLEQTFADFQARTGHTILERYGMTETGMNTSNPVDGPRRPGTVGLPLPGVEVRVVDEADRPLGTGEVGGLQVRGANVFKGYWRMPEKTAEEFTEDGWFRTGDIARIDADGYVAIVGRAKDMVISGGYNVYPKEVEALIDALDGVAESAVIGLPHPDLGEAVVAVVVPRDGATVEEAAVIAALKPRIAGYKVPKRVLCVDALPRNTMGKVQKNLLRDDFAATFES